MHALYPFFVTFIIIFLAELGDKTQLLVLSFASKSNLRNVLLGIVLGTLFSHGLAIVFGSRLGDLENPFLLFFLYNYTIKDDKNKPKEQKFLIRRWIIFISAV